MSALLALAAAAIAVTVLAEVAARAALRRFGGYYRYVPFRREHLAIDREALPKLSAVTRVEINGDGERGNPPPRRSERAYRALVLGGSAAECFLLDQSATWPAVVERQLNAPASLAQLDRDLAHVGNVSRAIVPCEHLVTVLAKVLPRYERLDLVLLMVGASDLVSWLEAGMPAAISDAPAPLDKLFEQHPEGPWGWSPRRTALYRILNGQRRRWLRPIVHTPDGGAWMMRVRRMRAEAPRLVDEVPDASPMLAHFERHLERLIATAERHGARVILVRQPWIGPDLSAEDEAMTWNFALGRPYREQVTTYFSRRVVDALMRQVDARAAAVAERLGVEHLDLLPRLERTGRMFYDELHFTPEGAEVVGEAVARAILARRA